MEKPQRVTLSTVKRGDVITGITYKYPTKTEVFVEVTGAAIPKKEAGPFMDQDEAEMELTHLMDQTWREMHKLPPKNAIRRGM